MIDSQIIIDTLFHLQKENIIKFSNEMVKAMLQLLTNCPPEVASLRKELLIAVRHILATDLRASMKYEY